MVKTSVFEDLLDPKLVRVLRLLLTNKGKLFHLQNISVESGVSISTVFRIMPVLVKKGIIEQIRVGKIKLYRLQDNEKSAELSGVLGR